MKRHLWFVFEQKLLLVALLVLAAFAAGCMPDFEPASLIDRVRVLGARVDVAEDPGRASPRAGETATVTWLVTAPGEMPPLSWAFMVAEGHAEPFALLQGQGTPHFDVVVPADAKAGWLSVVGQICAGGEPVIDEATKLPACTGGDAGTTAKMEIAIQTDDQPNRHPEVAGRALWFDGAEWAANADAADADGCGGLPRVTAGSKGHVLRVRTVGDDRERYLALRGDPPVPTMVREALQISQFTTAGELERVYSAVEASDGRAEADVNVKWTAPKADDVPEGGMKVGFTVVVRDGRGGLDWVTRSVCVER